MNHANPRDPGKTHYRAIFLSDIHLGTRGCQAERLLDFLKHHSCDRLYLVGDIIDSWRMKSSMYWPQEHGDEYDVITRYHRWVAFLGDVGYTVLRELNRYLNALRARLGYGHGSLSAWLKQRVKRAVSFISEFEEALAHPCRRQGFQGVVCGHIHHAEMLDLRYLNCGDWVESCTALVEDERGQFRILDSP
jgi:UDP-2,3-diacylglucosamine pyrophosphatase LpxH